jgi:hypothetical protein
MQLLDDLVIVRVVSGIHHLHRSRR